LEVQNVHVAVEVAVEVAAVWTLPSSKAGTFVREMSRAAASISSTITRSQSWRSFAELALWRHQCSQPPCVAGPTLKLLAQK